MPVWAVKRREAATMSLAKRDLAGTSGMCPLTERMCHVLFR